MRGPFVVVPFPLTLILCCENGPASLVPQGMMRGSPEVWDLGNIATMGSLCHPLMLVKRLA